MKTILRIHLSSAVAACLAVASSALGQPPPDPYSAQPIEALYDEAANEMEGGNFTSACPKLEAVVKMAPEGVGARITLAECYEGWGKLASAWSQYVAAEAMATKAKQDERAKKAAAKAAEIKPRLATLTIEVPEALRSAPGLSIVRDGALLADAQFGIAVPVDKGAHSVAVSATGKPTWKTDVTVEADGAQVKVEARLGEEPKPPPPKPTPPPPPTTPPPPTLDEPPQSGGAWRLPVAFSAMGLGIVGFGLGIELRNQAKDSFDASNQGHCNSRDQCDATGVALRDEALAKGNGATAAMILGGALTAGGIVLGLVTYAANKPQKKASISVTTNGLWLKGSW